MLFLSSAILSAPHKFNDSVISQHLKLLSDFVFDMVIVRVFYGKCVRKIIHLIQCEYLQHIRSKFRRVVLLCKNCKVDLRQLVEDYVSQKLIDCASIYAFASHILWFYF